MLETLTTLPVGEGARIEAGVLLRRLQKGERLRMPHARPMPGVGSRVHELRVDDASRGVAWRIVHRIDPDAILVVHWFEKKTQQTPQSVVDLCKRRLKEYDHAKNH